MSKKDQGQAAVYNIVVFNFAGKDTAKETIKEAKKAGALDGYDIVVEAIVEQDEKGKVHFHEPGHGIMGGAIGAGGGALLGLIGRPAGLLAWTVGGAVVGRVRVHQTSADGDTGGVVQRAGDGFGARPPSVHGHVRRRMAGRRPCDARLRRGPAGCGTSAQDAAGPLPARRRRTQRPVRPFRETG